MLSSDRVKKSTIHTRKEVISLFEELKSKINNAYEQESDAAFRQLLVIIKILYFLSPVPSFLAEINQIGIIQTISYLEKLLIKTSMIKLPIKQQFKEWLIAVILAFKNKVPNIQVQHIKELDEGKNQFAFVQKADAISFYQQGLNLSIETSNVNFIAVIIEFFRIHLINWLHSAKNNLELKPKANQWDQIIKSLVRACRLVDNLKKQQIGVSICYFLCASQQSFYSSAINGRILPFLIQSLARQNIYEAYGRKVLSFLKMLLMNLQEKDIQAKCFTYNDFQAAVIKFSRTFDNEINKSIIRDLMNVLEKKFSNINHEEKFMKAEEQYERYVRKESSYQLTAHYLHAINLCTQNDKIDPLISKYYKHFFSKMLFEQENLIIIKEILLIMSFSFKKGKQDLSVAQIIINKMEKIIIKSQYQEQLLSSKKRILINLLKILQFMLEYKDLFAKVIDLISQHKLMARFRHFSDYISLIYQRELYELQRMLKGQIKEATHNDIEKKLMQTIQKSLFEKSIGRGKKNNAEQDLEEIKLLYDLITNPTEKDIELPISPETIIAIERKIHPSNRGAENNLFVLQHNEAEDGERLRKDINLYGVKFLLQIFRRGIYFDKQQEQKVHQKIAQINSSKDELEEVYALCSEYQQIYYDVNIKLAKQNEFDPQGQYQEQQRLAKQSKSIMERIRITENYFQANLSQFQISKINKRGDLDTIAAFLFEAHIQGRLIIKYLKGIYELSKKSFMLQKVYDSESGKLIDILYNITQGVYGIELSQQNECHSLIDGIIYEFSRYHFVSLFNDRFLLDKDINYYRKILNIIENRFQIGLSKQRILTIESVLELFKTNRIDIQDALVKFVTQERAALVFHYIKGNYNLIGRLINNVLKLSHKSQENIIFWLQHKQNILNDFQKQNRNNFVYSFLSYYFLDCSVNQYEENSLRDIIEYILKNLQISIEYFNVDKQNEEKFAIKLHKINLISELLLNLRFNNLINSQGNLIRSQEDTIIKSIQKMLEIRKTLLETFKIMFIEASITNLLISLLMIYKSYYVNEKIQQGLSLLAHLAHYFSFRNHQIKVAACSLMRLFLLKDFKAARQTNGFDICKHYYQILPTEAQDHIQACERILESHNTIKGDLNIQRQFARYFFKQNIQLRNLQNIQTIQTESKNISNDTQSHQPVFEDIWDQKASMLYMNNLLKPPYIHGIKILSSKLPRIYTSQYANLLMEIFLSSEKLFNEDSSPDTSTLEDIQSRIIDAIPQNNCEIDELLYQVIKMNKVGASICLRKNNIGIKGIVLLVQRVFNLKSTVDIIDYTKMIHRNAENTDQLKYLFNYKLYDIVNEKFEAQKTNTNFVRIMSKLVKSTCKIQPFQEHYSIQHQLIECLTTFKSDEKTLVNIIEALSALSLDNDKNKRVMGVPATIQEIIHIIDEQLSAELTQKCYHLLVVLQQNNGSVCKTYLDMNIQEHVLKFMRKLLNENCYKQSIFCELLKILRSLSINAQSCNRILSHSYFAICKQTTAQALKNSNTDVFKLCLDILLKILIYLQISTVKVLKQLSEEALLPYLFDSIGNPMVNLEITDIFLELFTIIMSRAEIAKHCIEDQKENILKVMNDIAKNQQANEIIFQKWSKLLFIIFETFQYNYVKEILSSKILLSAANYIKSVKNVSAWTIEMNMKIIQELNKNADHKHLMLKYGMGQFIVQHIKMKNIKSDYFFKNIIVLTKMQEKHTFPPPLCTTIFEIAIRKLEAEINNDGHIIKIIFLLRKIKKNVSVTKQFCNTMAQFCISFISQASQQSSEVYFKISKEIICLLSYYITFNNDLKAAFYNKKVIQAARIWLKSSKYINENLMIHKILIFSIYNSQSFLVNVAQVNIKKIQICESSLQKGYKCFLYRLDCSSKNAIIRYDKLQREIVAFKYPDGIIKNKYRLPMKSILAFRFHYEGQNEVVYHQSNFPTSSNIFQRQVVPNLCVTLISLIQSTSEVRQVSVQFENSDDKANFVEIIKILLSKAYEHEKEEDIKWLNQ